MAIRDSVLSIVVQARDRASAALRNIRDRLRDTEGGTASLSERFRGLALRMAALAGTYLGINALRTSLQGILATGSKFETYEAQLSQVMGSIEAGQKATAWIKDFTTKTPFDIGDTTQAFIKLKSFGLDPMDGTFEALANQSAALGGSQETLNGIILATGQAWAKQKLQGEEILQLVERGVPVWDLLAQSTGRNVAELQKMSEAGQLGRKEIAALVATMGKASTGALQAQMGTLSGMLTRVRSEWGGFVNAIAQSGLQDYAKEQIGKLLEAVERLRANGKLQEWAERISTAFVNLGEAVKNLLSGSFGSLEGFANSASTTLQGLANAFAVVSNGAAFMVNSLKVTYNGAVVFLSGFLSTILQMTSRTARALGAQGFAEMADAAASSMNAIYDAHIADMEANAQDLQRNMAGIYSGLSGEAANAVQQTGAAAEQALKLTGDALRQAADAAAAEVARLEAEAERLEASMAAAAANTQKAWEVALREQGANQADAIAQLNAAITTEGDLRTQAAENAKALNVAVAESHKLVASAAEEATKGQSKAADEARASLQRLGIDTGMALDKVGDAARNSIGALDSVATEIHALGADTQQSAALMGQAVRNALQDVSTAEEFKAIREKIKALFDAGQIDSTALQEALTEIRKREDEIQGKALEEPGKRLAEGMKEGKAAVEQATEATNTLGAATDDAADKAKKGFGAGLAGVINAVTASMHSLGSAAGAAFERMQFGREALTGLDELRAKLAAAEAETDRLSSAMSQTFSGSFASYFTELSLNAARVREEYLRQRIALDSLLQSVERGGMSMSALAAASRRASTQFDLLDDTDLSGLQSAIDSARSRLESLNDSASSTLDSLRQRLAQVRGDTEQAEELRYQSERKRLEQQLEEARESGATDAVRDYQQALDQLRQIREVERQNAREAAQEEATRKREAEDRQKAETAAKPTQEPQDKQQTRTEPAGQRIILQAPGGREVEVTTTNPTELLRALEQAGLRHQA